jgi:hypothetical protein
MVIVDDTTNNFDFTILRTVSIEYNIIQSRIHSNILKFTQSGMIIGYHMSPICNLLIVPYSPLVCMVIVDDVTNNWMSLHLELSPQSTTEYSILHQYSQISTKWEENKIP